MSSPPARSVGRRLGLAALLMGGSIFLSRIVGYLREAIIAAKHGATADTDVYFASFTLPDMMNYMVAGGALSITFIPIFSKYLAEGREDEGWDTFSLVATTVGALLLVLVVAGMIWTEPLVRLLVPGFTPEQVARTASLTRIVLPGQLAFYWGGLVQATILSKQRFGPVALVPLVYNGCIIAGGVLLDPFLGIAGFSWGALIGAFAGALTLPLWAQRGQVRFRPRFSLADPRFRAFVRLTLPVALGFSLVTVDEWVVRWFGSALAEGTISWLNNARRLVLVPIAILGQAAGQAVLPFLTRLWAEGKREEMAALFARTLGAVIALTLAASVFLALHALPIVRLLYERGAYTLADSVETAAILALLSLGIVAWAVQAIAARLFYARQDTWTPMIVSSLAVVASLPLYALLVRLWGHRGLALATTLGMALTAAATLAMLARRTGALSFRSLLATSGRALAAAVGAGLFSSGAAAALRVGWAAPSPLLEACLAALVFGAVWLLLALALRVEGVREVGERVRRRLRRAP